MTRKRLLALLWTLTFLSVALGSVTAYVGPLYWLSAFLLWATGFCTLVAQSPRLSWNRAATPAWLLYSLGVGAIGIALCYFAASPTLFAGWFVGLTSVLMLLAAPLPQTGRWALLAATACFFVLPWVVLRHTSMLPSIAAGNEAHLKLLLWCGADPNERPQDETPLIAAVQLGRADLVETLLRHSADPNGRSSAFMNSTPVLFYAAQLPADKQRVLGLLLQFGVDSTLTNGSGQRVRLPR
ncbi:ankyrin repeat domain-containing protein [Hymenobacter profundi]|uniref:Ankyrin repeat domain-containing protein n=1 Tax=Hymenobacter profundi TaxID=1982110 RepID=A0ABS6WWC4_9BACT|nr:ankyrin repeat domain-containing protein [Hymenobacter profundi]MBW3127729.1 ankyrin repeat domain-containing protein [Hymenobacter profundi]